MKNISKYFTLYGIILLIGQSCSPVYYSNVGQNVPMFKQKGEAAITGGIMASSPDGSATSPSTIFDAGGFNLQAALAVDSSTAIISSLYTADIGGDWSVSGSYFEAGVGKFRYSPKTKLTGEIFLGFGYGSIKSSLDEQKIKSNFMKFFIQPSGGFSSEVIDMAFTPRIGLVNFLKSSDGGSVAEDFFSEKKTTFVFEPGLTIRAGYKNVKLQYQINFSTFNYDSEEFDPIMKTFGSLNIFILISNRWK